MSFSNLEQIRSSFVEKFYEHRQFYSEYTQAESSINPILIESNIEELREIISKGDIDTGDSNKDEQIQDIVNSNHEENIQYQERILSELAKSRQEHKEQILQIESLKKELTQKKDLIEAKKQIIGALKEESGLIQSKHAENIQDLKSTLGEYLPHKRTFKVSMYFLTLFSGCFFSALLFNIKIIEPFWNMLGVIVSCGFIFLSIGLRKDWDNSNGNS